MRTLSIATLWLMYFGWLLAPSSGHDKFVLFCVGAIALGATFLVLARDRDPETRLSALWWRYADVWVLALVLLYGLAVQRSSPSAATSDGTLYFAYLRSLLFDGDLAIGPELQYLMLPERHHYVVPLGPALIWLPAYLAVYVVDALGVAADLWSVPEKAISHGLSGSYLHAILQSSFVVAAAGLMALHLRLRSEFGRTTAFVTSILTYGATTLAFYAIYEASLPHAASFGLVALFVVLAERHVRQGDPSIPAAVLLGALYSLAVVVRPQNGVFGIFLLAFLLLQRRRSEIRHDWTHAAAFLAGTVPLFAAQAVAARVLVAEYGYSLAGSGGSYLNLGSPHWNDVLFSAWHGFFSWTPVAYVAALGILLYLRRNRAWALSAVFVLFAMAWVNGSAVDWHGAWAFGGRRFTSTLVVLAPGLACVVALLRRRPLLLLGSVAVAAIVGNFFLMVQWNKDLISREAPVPMREILHGYVDQYFDSGWPYPFSFPANFVFALREQLPIEAYDTLGFYVMVPEVDLRFSREVEALLLSGWSPRPCVGEEDPCWKVASGGEMLLPFSPSEAGGILTVRARGLPRGSEAVLSVFLNDYPLGDAVIGIDWKDMVFEPPAHAWRRGFDRVRFVVSEIAGRASSSLTTGQDRALITRLTARQR